MRKRITYKVTCPCGGAVVLEVRGFGQELPCATCEGKIVVAWGRDAKNITTIPVVVRHVPAPGKPALPLRKVENRPILKTQVVPQARFFDCVCGERNVLMGGAAPGKSVNCSGCDRIHVLEAVGSEPVAVRPPKAAAPPPPPPPAPVRKPGLGEILCKCGEILPPRTSRTGRDFACPACGREGHVVPAPDGSGIQAVFTSEPTSAPGPRPSARPPAPAAGGSAWTCPCGTPIPAQAAMAGKLSSCPSCGRQIRVEKRQAPLSTMTVMRPVFTEVKPPLSAACPCGADLPVSESLAGELVSCGGCSRTLEVVAKDGRVRLREHA